MSAHSAHSPAAHPMRRVLAVGGILLAIMLLGMLVSFAVSPAPGAHLIRRVFQNNDQEIMAILQEHKPDDVTSILNEPYRDNDPDALLDVHIPDVALADGEALPTVVWTHGGAWVAGSKEEWAPYYMVLASHGYTVVGIAYSLGPGQTYPTALDQLNDALAYVREHAERFHIDPDRIVLAGDSAGAQITSQYATMVTNPDFAAAVGITPTLEAEHLRGVLLYCGIYDFVPYFDASGLIGWGARVSIWAYTGNRARTFDKNPALAQMSTLDHVTENFPPAFISGGNGDPLTPHQSKPLAEKLDGMDVHVTTLFFPDDHQPPQPHEYQFNLDTPEAQQALDESITFLEHVFGER